jgi:glycosyltransferase involved in cell wall biosynthesis
MLMREKVSDAELVRMYSAALCTICASRLEPVGLTALESLSCGTPVVAINEGGFRETVCHERNGLLVTPDASAIAAGVAEVVAGRLESDPGILRASVAGYNWERTVAGLHEAYELVAGSARGRN